MTEPMERLAAAVDEVIQQLDPDLYPIACTELREAFEVAKENWPKYKGIPIVA